MKRVLYVVNQTLGPHWESSTSIICGSWRHSGAQKIIDREKRKDKEHQKRWDAQEAIEKKVDAHRKVWEVDHPAPQMDQSLLKDIPKWIAPKGQPHVITDEMRAERAAIKQYNEDRWADHNKLAGEWRALWKEERARFLTSIGEDPDAKKIRWPEEHISYEIEEVMVPDLEDEDDTGSPRNIYEDEDADEI